MPETDPGLVNDLLPVEAAEPLPTEAADALVQDLRPRLDPAEESILWQRIWADHQAALNDRIEWESKLAVWDEQYYGILPEKSFPWQGCANFNVPLTMLGVESLKPRLVEAVLGEDPPILVRQTEGYDEARQEKVDLFLNWQLMTELELAPLVTDSAHRFLNPGIVFGKTTWAVTDRHVRAIRVFPAATELRQIIEACVEGPIVETVAQGASRFEITTRLSSGAKRTTTLTFAVDETNVRVLIERTERRFEGPEVRLPEPSDMFVPINGGGDVQKLPFIQERLRYDEQTLRRKVREGVFDKAVVETLLDMTAPTGDESQLDTQEDRTLRTTVEGTTDVPETNVKADQWEIIEDYRPYDIDGDGWDEEIVVWVCHALPDRFLGWDYLDNLYAHGRRPYRTEVYSRIPGRFYGLSFPEVVRPIQEEMNSIHNQRVDAGTLANTFTGFYRSSSTMTPDTLKVRIGELTPVDNVQDILFPPIPHNASEAQNEEALLWQIFERLTGITDMSLGRQPNRVGASRTATGVSALLSEAGLRYKTTMLAFQRFWRGIFEDIFALDQQYLPPGKEFRVTGKVPEVIRITNRAEIAGKYDLRIASSTENMNRQIMREDASVKLNLCMNPVLQQSGLIGFRGLDRAVRRFFRAYGDDPDMYLEPMGERIVRTPEEELGMFLAGEDPQPSMAENLMQHLQSHQLQMQNQVVMQELGVAGRARLVRHIAATTQMVQMQQMILAQQSRGARPGGGGSSGPGASPVVGEQAMNAQIGREAVTGPAMPGGFGNGATPGGRPMG